MYHTTDNGIKINRDRRINDPTISVDFYPVPSCYPPGSLCVPVGCNPCGSRDFVELLSRFELETSSLPILPKLFSPIVSCSVLAPGAVVPQRFPALSSLALASPVIRFRTHVFGTRMGFVWVSHSHLQLETDIVLCIAGRLSSLIKTIQSFQLHCVDKGKPQMGSYCEVFIAATLPFKYSAL